MKDIAKFILCIMLLCFSKFAQASLEDRGKINSLSLSKDKDLILINDYLQKSDILNYFMIREKLLSFSYEELLEINRHAETNSSLIQLNKLIKNTLSNMEQENLLLFQEEFYVNNTPTLLGSPFYDSEKKFTITDLKPHAERLYFSNLKLNYRKNKLRAIADDFWINPVLMQGERYKKQDVLYEEANCVPGHSLLNEAEKLWSYNLRSDNLFNWVFTMEIKSRQRIKRYEESAIYPIFYKGSIILRNEYRLFCVDLLTGREIWNFSIDEAGNEFYQLRRHPHHNSYGYEMFMEKDIVYTELSGKLIAVSVKDNYRPKLLWEKKLGEYTVCIKPIKSENTLIVGLVNARQEFWICGFNPECGSLEWSTYIGIQSFLSPACVISMTIGSKIIFGTNHGVLVCLRPENGEIIWLRKYTPRKYSYFEYWFKGYYKETFLDKGFIAFDTQFIDIGNDGLVYYKPRESDYLYVVDPTSGKLEEKLLIDSDQYYLLKATDGKIVLLEKPGDKKSAQLKVVQLKTGDQLSGITLKGGALKNVIQVNGEEIIFKVGDTVYFLRAGDGNNPEYSKIVTSQEEWLYGFDNGYLIVGKERELNCLSVYNKKNVFERDAKTTDEFFDLRKSIKHNLRKAIESDRKGERFDTLIKKILYDIRATIMPASEILPFIKNNLYSIRNSRWGLFISKLADIYDNEIVTYKGIEIRFSNLIRKLVYTESDKGDFSISIKGRPAKRGFQVLGGGTGLVPVTVIDGQQAINFFIVLNFDQLFCVNEAGRILWDRKIYHCRTFPGSSVSLLERIVEAYLYKNILIFNDGVNIVAVNVNDGRYIWSMTNKGVEDSSRFLTLFMNKNIEFNIKFLNDRAIILHGNKIYSVDPLTGYCENSNELDITGAAEMLVSNDRIFILSSSLGNIKVLDKQLHFIGDFVLDIVKDQIVTAATERMLHTKETYLKSEITLGLKSIPWLTEEAITAILDALPNAVTRAELMRIVEDKTPESALMLAMTKYNMIIGSDLIALSLPPYLYLVDARNGELKDKINIGNSDRCYMEICNNNLLAIVPFRRLISIGYKDSSVKINWKLEFESDELLQDYLSPRFYGRHYYYFLVGKNIISLTRNKGSYWFISVDIESGKKICETPIEKSNGFFVYLSNYVRMNNLLYFIFSTSLDDSLKEAYNIVMPTDQVSYDISSRLFQLDVNSGEITAIRNFPTVSTRAFQRSILIDTKGYLLSSVYAAYISANRK